MNSVAEALHSADPVDSLEDARRWVADFVAWYNGVHLHSGLRYVTPNDRHEGRDDAILAKRKTLLL